MTTLSKLSVITLLLSVAGGATLSAADDAAMKKAMELGQQKYVTCLACHGPDGKGLKAGPLTMAPAYTESKLLNANDEIPISIVLKGIMKEDAKYAGMMAPLGAALTDEDLAAVLTYVRNSFGMKGNLVKPETVKEVRAKLKDRNEPFKRAELDEMVKKAEAEKKKAGS